MGDFLETSQCARPRGDATELQTQVQKGETGAGSAAKGWLGGGRLGGGPPERCLNSLLSPEAGISRGWDRSLAHSRLGAGFRKARGA